MSTSPVRGIVAIEDYLAVRDETEALAEPLSAEDQQIQSMPDASPTKWHRAHTTWFFETFLLRPHLPSYRELDPDHRYLYNSYYELIGDRHPRHERGLISRPTAEEVGHYRRHVDAAMAELLAEVVPNTLDLEPLVRLGLQHEQQHQELILSDIKHVLSKNPTRPAYHDRPASPVGTNPSWEWVEFDGGLVEIGATDDETFSFDNEWPRHREYLEPFRLADRLVTNGDWLDFMADDGYHESSHWLSEGWGIFQWEVADSSGE